MHELKKIHHILRCRVESPRPAVIDCDGTQLSDGEQSHRWPWFLPHGKAVLFMAQAQGGTFDDGTLEAVFVDTRERKVLHRGGTYPRYASSGHLLFGREATLFAMRFDAGRMQNR